MIPGRNYHDPSKWHPATAEDVKASEVTLARLAMLLSLADKQNASAVADVALGHACKPFGRRPSK